MAVWRSMTEWVDPEIMSQVRLLPPPPPDRLASLPGRSPTCSSCPCLPSRDPFSSLLQLAAPALPRPACPNGLLR